MNHTGRDPARVSLIRRSTSVSSHKLIKGRSASRVSGVDVTKSHPRRSSDHFAALQRSRVSFSVGKRLNASATMLKDASTPARCPVALGSTIASRGVASSSGSICS